MSPTVRTDVCALLSLMLCACDAQVDTSYPGTSLLEVRGAVAVPDGYQDRELVPALAFQVEAEYLLHYVDVLVETQCGAGMYFRPVEVTENQRFLDIVLGDNLTPLGW